jgi:hypothetical protein
LDATWDVMSGRARIWSWVVAHPPLLAAYADQAPYNVVVVELDDDDPSIRLCGNVVAEVGGRLDAIDASSLSIGHRCRSAIPSRSASAPRSRASPSPAGASSPDPTPSALPVT